MATEVNMQRRYSGDIQRDARLKRESTDQTLRDALRRIAHICDPANGPRDAIPLSDVVLGIAETALAEADKSDMNEVLPPDLRT